MRICKIVKILIKRKPAYSIFHLFCRNSYSKESEIDTLGKKR